MSKQQDEGTDADFSTGRTLAAPPQRGDTAQSPWLTESNADTDSQVAVAQTMAGPDSPAPAAARQSSPRSAPADTPPVHDWDRYEFLGALGHGGMGTVWKARDRQLGRIVAIKFIRGDDPELVQRFQQEARAQARIDHPQICRVYEIGVVVGKPYIAMQFIDGRTLGKSGLSRIELLQVTCEVAFGLHEAHRLGILHRDLKPDNIMVERREDGRLVPVIMDFGLARETGESTGLTQTGQMMGTPAYMSPEQARGDVRRLDRRTDVYSLGATLYDLLTGRPPFVGDQLVAVLYALVNRDPPDPRRYVKELPADLCTIVLKCLAKEPSERYDSAKELGEDLQRYINGERVLARPKGWLQRLGKQVRENWQAVAAGTVALMWLMAFLSQLAYARVQERKQEQRARKQATEAQHVTQEVKNLEQLMHSAYQLPLHDVSRERRRMMARLEALEKQLQGGDALGPALRSEALGRGYLTLQDYGRAESELRHALALGHETAAIDYALGIALGKSYERALDALRRSGDQGWLRSQRPILKEQFLPQITTYLERGRSADRDSAAFVDALLAYYREDYGRAIELAQAIFADSPWVYEAKKIEADSVLARAKELRQDGDYARAQAELTHAQWLYGEAITIGRSDPALHEALVDSWDLQLAMARDRNMLSLDLLTPALEACDHASAAAPYRGYAWAKRAWLYQYVATLTSEYLQAGIAAAQKSVTLEPDEYGNHDILGASYLAAAKLQMGSGKDPSVDLQRASQSLRRALELLPDFAPAYNKLGNVHLSLVVQSRKRGRDVYEDFLAGVGYYERAIQLSPDSLLPYTNLIAISSHRLDQLVEGGRFDDSLFERAKQYHRQCKAKNASYLFCDISFASMLELRLAAHEAAGADIAQDYDDLMEIVSAIEKLHKDDGYGLREAMAAHTLLAQHQLRAHENAAGVINRLDEALRRCRASVGADGFCAEADVRRLWVHAEAALAEGGDPLPWLRQAADAAKQSILLSPHAVEPLVLYAESQLRIARREPGLKLRRDSLQNGRWATDQGLRVHVAMPQLLVVQGELLYEQAKLEPDRDKRIQLAERAVADIDRALARNRFLRRDHAQYLGAAKALLTAR